MPGFLDGGLAAALYAGFKDKLLKGTLSRESVAASGGLDELGDPLATSPITYACQGFLDAYTVDFAAKAGIPLTDAKVCIFAASLAVRPLVGDLVGMVRAGATTWHRLSGHIATDPAQALWECQGTEVPAP